MTNGDDYLERRRRKRVRSWKKARIILLSIGAAAVLIGIGLYVTSRFYHANHGIRLRGLSVIYVLTGCGLLALRSLMIAVDHFRKRKYRH